MTYLKLETFLEMDDSFADVFIKASPPIRVSMLIGLLREKPELVSFSEPYAIRDEVCR